MKFKRLIATVLATTMVLSSQLTAYTVSAAQSEPVEETTGLEERLTTEEENSLVDNASDMAEVKNDEVVKEDTIDEATSTEKKTEEKAEELGNPVNDSVNKEETATSEIELNEETSEETEEAIENEEIDLEEDEEAIEVEEAEEEEESDGDVELQKSTDYFEVDEDGVLKVKSGKTLKEEVYIPANCVTIPDNIFKNNRVVKTIHFDNWYGVDASHGTYEQKLTTISPGAFEGSAIEEIDGLPSGVTQIPENTFLNSNLRTITFQTHSEDTKNSTIGITAHKIVSIGTNAFKGSNLHDAIVYPNCTSIGASAFEDCSRLTEATFDKVEEIGASAFTNCSSLLRFNSGIFPTTLTAIGTDAFKSSGLISVDLRETSLNGEIGTNTFKNCVNLVSVYLPINSNVTRIATGCFEGCRSLTTVSFPEPDKDNTGAITTYGIEVIDSEAFKNCSSLSRVNIKNVYSIGSAAFAGCNKLTNIEMGYDADIHNKGDMNIASDAFVHYSTSKDRSTHFITAYETEAQVYADKHGYTFKTAYKTYNVNVPASKQAKISASKTSAREGDEIEVTIMPNTGYSLTDLFVGDMSLSSGKVALKICDDKQQVFTFVMPDYDVSVNPTIVANKDVATGTIDYYFKNASIEHHTASGEYTIAHSGEKRFLYVTNDGKELPVWLFKYSSSDSTVATISNKGEVVALREGWTDIKATLIANTKRSITCHVHVTKQTDIKKIEIIKNGTTYKGSGIICNDKRVTVGEDTIEGVTYPLVQIMKSTIDLESISFEVNIDAAKEGGTKVLAKTDWSSSDTSIAKTTYSSTSVNKNYVTVNKGSLGEALITISTLNEHEKYPNHNNDKNKEDPKDGYVEEDNATKVIVRVVDNTPRVASKTVDVNAQKEHNYTPVYAVYDGKIYDDAKLRLYYDINCTKECTDFDIKYNEEENSIDIVTTALFDKSFKLNATKNYSNMYLKGTFDEKYGNFVIKMPTIKLTNKQLAPKYTSTNKINLFYNTTADIKEIGSVTVKNNLPAEWIAGDGDETGDGIVNGAYLISKDNYSRHGYDAKSYINSATDKDLFNMNFSTYVDEYNVITIKRRDGVDPIKKDASNKNILSGYLYVEYVGYKYPVMTAYTVPTQNVAPSYVLNMTTATANTNVKGQSYDLWLYAKNDKTKTPISLARLNSADDLASKGLEFDYNQSTTTCFNASKLREKINNDIIHMSVSTGTGDEYAEITPRAGKSVIKIHMDTWSDDGKNDSNKYLRYTFTLKTTSAKPTVSFKIQNADPTSDFVAGKAVTFNKAFTGEKFTFKAITNQPSESEVVGFMSEPVPQGNVSQKTEAGKLSFEPSVDDENSSFDSFVVNIADGTIKNGTYSYKITPVVKYKNGGNLTDMPALSFSVTIKNAQPTITVSNSGVFKLNYENVVYNMGAVANNTYAIGGVSHLTNANQYQIVDDDADITATTSGLKDKDPYKEFSLMADMTVGNPQTCATNKIPISMEKKSNVFAKGFTSAYSISGYKIVGPGGVQATVKPFTVKIQGYNAAPTMKIKASGSVDFVDRTSCIKYTATLSNFTGAINSVKLEEYAPDGSIYDAADMHFGLDTTPANPVVLKITNPAGTYDKVTKPGGSKPIKPNVTYKLKLTYTVNTTGSKPYEFIVNVKPTQNLPKLTLAQHRNYLYAGERYGWDQKTMSVVVNMPKNKGEVYYLDSLPVGSVAPLPEKKMELQWASGTPDAYKKAFDIGRLYYTCNTDGTRTGYYCFDVKLKNAAALMQEKTYTLKFVAYYEGQATDTVGSPINVTVNLRK